MTKKTLTMTTRATTTTTTRATWATTSTSSSCPSFRGSTDRSQQSRLFSRKVSKSAARKARQEEENVKAALQVLHRDPGPTVAKLLLSHFVWRTPAGRHGPSPSAASSHEMSLCCICWQCHCSNFKF